MIKKIIDLLLERPYGVSELKRLLTINSDRTLLNYLRKVKDICKRKGWSFVVYPARCKKCGYIFSSKEIIIPSKCPRCGSEWMEEPRFYIKK